MTIHHEFVEVMIMKFHAHKPALSSIRHLVRWNYSGQNIRFFLSFQIVVMALAFSQLSPCATAAEPTFSNVERADNPLTSRAISVRKTGLPSPGNPSEILEFKYGDPSLSRVRYWWNGFTPDLLKAPLRYGNRSNIRQTDYSGPESCKQCHAANYEKWTQHSHSLMNALATPKTIKGDFSDREPMNYLGGKARFYAENATNYMRLERDGVVRKYAIFRTIGSRFFQYYAGKLVEGPEPADHPVRLIDHVLPLGYLIQRKVWMPIIHIDEEKPDGERADAFAAPSDIPYDKSCSVCHTTWPAGDWLSTTAGLSRTTYFSPFSADFEISSYLKEMHPGIAMAVQQPGISSEAILPTAMAKISALPASEHAVTLGISCEACHNGSKSHAENSTETTTAVYPLFFPCSPNLLSHGPSRSAIWTRKPQNLNWTCSRCHSGGRPMFAGGMATWNSVEFADATKGSCYLKDPQEKKSMAGLTCVECHNPHQGIGVKWQRTAAEDDAKCITCHKQFESKSARALHSHHKQNSTGDNCMNCHMPKINEGLQDVVRTHTIFKPTEQKMIEANQPNACNLCHLKENIDWTLGYLKQWYPKTGSSYSEEKLAANYPNRKGPVGLGWLKSPDEHTRLVAAETMAKARASWALPELFDALDDGYLINRRFTQLRLEEMLGTDLNNFGYRFYQTKLERIKPISKIRGQFLPKFNGSISP
ncbi:MAG: hypothetical protein JWN25_549 [Verrucomicrobiales bacterium]|nr:hypothetical protein [Verrucomicrobiales bacterium]